MERDQVVDLPQGRIRYHDSGTGSPIVFVHGVLVNATLWRKVVPELDRDFRCIAPDLPLGSHAESMRDDADVTPRGVAHLVADFLEALELQDVTIVANDSGGAITQLLITERPARVARVVLTPCDCYDHFPPPAFRPMVAMSRVPGGLAAGLAPLRLRAPRRLPFAYGWLTKEPIPDEVLDGWLAPFFADRGVRRDAARFFGAASPRDTLAAAERLEDFAGRALVVWASEDRFFKLDYGRRLAGEFRDGRFVELPDCRTFMPEDQPRRLAELIAGFVREPAATSAASSAG